MNTLVLNSIITCPHCGSKKEEEMTADSCLFFYECKSCHSMPETKTRRLLCILFIWHGAMSANTKGKFLLLRNQKQ